MPSWVYILRCADNSYYTGCTTNIDQRLDQHYRDKIGYTSKRKPLEFLWSEEFANLDDAAAFEKQVKGWSRAKKEALMRGDWPAIQQLARARRKPHQRQPEPVEGEKMKRSKRRPSTSSG